MVRLRSSVTKPVPEHFDECKEFGEVEESLSNVKHTTTEDDEEEVNIHEIIVPRLRNGSFEARISILDIEVMNNSNHPMRGFLALFWITIALYAAISIYYGRGVHYLGLNLALWHNSYRDFEALFVMVCAIYLYTFVALPYQWLLAKGILDSSKLGELLLCRHVIQSGPILMALFVARYRDWPHLQTGSLLSFAIVMNLKMHSFLSANERFDIQYQQKLNRLRSCSRRRISSDSEEDYPNNLNVVSFTKFLWYPTVIYQLKYPKTDKIRWGYVMERSAGCFVIFVMFYIVMGHYIHPILQLVDERPFLDVLVDLLLPCLASALLLFFLIFEYLLNWAAEITRFADREFYSDWWNSNDMAEFARKWNIPIHRFLQHHIYDACQEHYGFSKMKSRFITFLFSSILHELILSFTVRRLKFWILGMQMMQLPLMITASMIGLKRYPFLANCIWWLMIILGIPILVLLYTRDNNLVDLQHFFFDENIMG